jgi:hypothetical protein
VVDLRIRWIPHIGIWGYNFLRIYSDLIAASTPAYSPGYISYYSMKAVLSLTTHACPRLFLFVCPLKLNVYIAATAGNLDQDTG